MSSSLSDSNDEEDFRSPPTPPSFTRVGGAPIEGKTSARTSLNYIHPQNAKYLMKAPVRPKEKVGATKWVELIGWRSVGGAQWVELSGWGSVSGAQWVELSGWRAVGGAQWVELSGWSSVGVG